MKLLKVWNWLLYIAGLAVYFYGIFSGNFFSFFTGPSDLAHLLTVLYVRLLLLAITVSIVIHAIENK